MSRDYSKVFGAFCTATDEMFKELETIVEGLCEEIEELTDQNETHLDRIKELEDEVDDLKNAAVST